MYFHCGTLIILYTVQLYRQQIPISRQVIGERICGFNVQNNLGVIFNYLLSTHANIKQHIAEPTYYIVEPACVTDIHNINILCTNIQFSYGCVWVYD